MKLTSKIAGIVFATLTMFISNGLVGCANAQVPNDTHSIVTQAAPTAPAFDGHALYKAFFEALRDNHIMLQDPAARAKWVAEWEHKYDNDPSLKTEEGADKACVEMMHSLGQRFDYYMTPDQTKQEQENRDASLVGIGATLEITDLEGLVKSIPKGATKDEIKKILVASTQHPVTVTEPFENGPAAKAGIVAGDKIVQVDGKSVYGQSLQDIVGQIRGKPNTQVAITIERTDTAGKTTQVTYTITRDKVIIHDATSKDLGNGITYIKLRNFESQYALDEMGDALTAAAKGKAVILDLRNNPGGSLTMVEIMGAFLLPSGTELVIERRNGDALVTETIVLQEKFMFQTVESTDKPKQIQMSKPSERPDLLIPADMPVVVLVNGNSYSASEILSGLLQANHRAIVVGEPTGGKGVGQNVIKLPNDRGTHVTNFRFLPGGKPMDWIGVVPDIEVKPSTTPKTDDQLDAAIKAAQEQIAKNTALGTERQGLKQKHEDDFKKQIQDQKKDKSN